MRRQFNVAWTHRGFVSEEFLDDFNQLILLFWIQTGKNTPNNRLILLYKKIHIAFCFIFPLVTKHILHSELTILKYFFFPQ